MPLTERILFACAACGYRARVSDAYAGRRVRCPRCECPVVVEVVLAQRPQRNEPVSTATRRRIERGSLSCAACGCQAKVPAEYVGKRIRCPRCRAACDVTAGDASPSGGVAALTPVTAQRIVPSPPPVDSASTPVTAQRIVRPPPPAPVAAPEQPQSIGADEDSDAAPTQQEPEATEAEAAAPEETRRAEPRDEQPRIEPSRIEQPRAARAISGRRAARPAPRQRRMAAFSVALFVGMAAAATPSWMPRTPASGPATPLVESTRAAAAPSTLAATGQVVPAGEIEVVCLAKGRLQSVLYDVGDEVPAGGIVAQLDQAEEERAVRKAQAQLALSDGALAQARQNLLIAQQETETDQRSSRAALAAAESRARDAHARADRQAQLFAKKLVSQEDADSAREAALQGDAELEAARAAAAALATKKLALENHRQEIKVAEAQLQADTIALEEARERLAGTTVTAPIGGVVTARHLSPGATIDADGATPILALCDRSRMFVDVAVDAAVIARIAVGSAATIRCEGTEAQGSAIAAVVSRIAPKAERADDRTTIQVRVEAKERLADLRPGTSARVEFTGAAGRP